jgi:ABC-type multidrug transport system fused ATPase/permease subunit
MKQTQPIIQLLCRLWRHISSRRRWQFAWLLVLTLLASIAEILSIGAVFPFLGVLTAPERIFEHSAAQPVIHALGLTTPVQLLMPLTFAFGAAVLISGAMRLLLLWASTRLAFANGADISMSIYRRTLYQPYSVHCARNSSEVVSAITGKTYKVIHNVLLPTLILISSCVMLAVLLVTLLSVEPTLALAAFGGFGLIYVLIIRLTRSRVLENSQCMARESVQVIKSLQEGLGGIRDVLIDGSQATYCQTYQNADLRMREAQGNSAFISASPRYAMEALGMLMIAALAYVLAQKSDGIGMAVPVLGALALGAQRLLPLLQGAYASWTEIQSAQISLQDALEFLDQPLPDYADQPVKQALPFNNEIRVNQIDFRYSSQSPHVLKQLSLTITKGSRIGFIGTTSSGKSTLLDIVMGLLQPTNGTLEIDGQAVTTDNVRSWQANIAHVPQAIFLIDSSIEENIALGVPKEQIDRERVKEAARQAQLSDSIENWPNQYQTFVGERGVRLSGGQRQRIGIARALYKQASVIVFDEATSALDNETEQAVMNAIENLSQDLTLLIIAHRLTTLKNCSQIVVLDAGSVKRNGSYKDIIGDSIDIK